MNWNRVTENLPCHDHDVLLCFQDTFRQYDVGYYDEGEWYNIEGFKYKPEKIKYWCTIVHPEIPLR